MVSIREFIRSWTLPFLNEYSSVEAITRGYERKDERLERDRRFVVFVAAAYILLGQPLKAMQVLEETFRRPGAKRLYGKAFEFVAASLQNS